MTFHAESTRARGAYQDQVFADVALSRRLEAVEGEAGAAFVDARALLSPDVHAS